MADFNTFWEPSGSPIRPQEGIVEDNSYLGKAVSGLGDAAGILFKGSMEEKANTNKLAAEKFNAQTISNFMQDQVALSEAVETGQMTSQQARSRMRANFTRAIADNPLLTEDLNKVHNSIVASKLSEQAIEGTPEEQAQAKALQDVISAGWVSADASQEEKMVAIEKKRNFEFNMEMLKGQQQQLAAMTAQLSYQRGQLGIQKDRQSLATGSINQQAALLGLEQAQLKRQSQHAAAAVAIEGLTPFKTGLREIAKQMKSGAVDPTTGQRMMEEQMAFIEQQVRQTGAFAGSDQLNNYMALYQNTMQLEMDYATGKKDLETYNLENEKNLARQTLSITADPVMARFAAVSEIFPTTNIVTQGDVNNSVVRFLQGAIEPESTPANLLPTSPQEKKDVKVALSAVKSGVESIYNGKATERQLEQVSSWFNNSLKGVEMYGPYAQDPAQYQELVNLLGDPKVGQLISKGDLSLNEEALSNAGDIIQHNYMNKVIPELKTKFEDALLGGSTVGGSPYGAKPRTQATDSIEIKFIGSGITFQAKPGSTTPGLARRVQELNKTVKPLANTAIRTTAHLRGTTDYKATYEELFQEVLGGASSEE